jgi:CHASE3 domain sensor protein
MQTVYKRFSIVTGFGLLVLVLLANAWITRRQLSVQTENQVGLTTSRLVLLALARTESVLKDAETGQRGFLYTEDPKYLAPYYSATGQVDISRARLWASIASLRCPIESICLSLLSRFSRFTPTS